MAETSGIVGRGTVVKGNLSGSGDVVVHGRVEGTVALKDQLTIEEEGKVFADVEVENLVAHGELSGDISAGDKVLIGKYSGSEVKIDDKEFLILREEDVLAILE